MRALFFAFLTAGATTVGGLLAIRVRDRLHLVLGLSAGLLLGLVGFDLLPEVFNENHHVWLGTRSVSIAILAGFLILHVVEKAFATHEPHDSEYETGHTHKHVVGTLSGLALLGHVFLDGVGIGAAFQISNQLGISVFFALLVHAFNDGLNSATFMVRHGKISRRAIYFVLADAAARVGGAALGTVALISGDAITLYLALFAGFVIYIATAHILPEAHANHPTRWTLFATIGGIGLMWLLVAHGA